MLLQSLGALSKAPGGAGSIWKYLEAVVRATGVSGRFAYGFRSELHFADKAANSWFMTINKLAPTRLHKMHDQESLTLR
jgi:hypothetical protein